MYYYLTLTTKCNLLCSYCYGSSNEDFMTEEDLKNYDIDIPTELSYNINKLKELSKNDDNFSLTFYGGEPLLRIDLIKKIIDEVPAKKFMLQTNGIFLNKLEKKYINKFDTILVSIDGGREVTDKNRGKGVFDKIINNLNLIRKKGFKGEVIARMVATEGSNIYKNVTDLIKEGFTSIHWQLDAQFWSSDYKKRDFKNWSLKYNKDVEKLINYWFEDMKSKRRVLKIYPFIGLVHDLYHNIKSPMRCGAGHSLFGIQTDGKIVGCPITAGYKPLYVGDLNNIKLDKNNKVVLKNLELKEPCPSCEVLDICGGRCLYANYTKLWGEKGFNEVCGTIKFLINSLKKVLPEIKNLIKEGIIKEKDLEFNRYNGCEIIP